MAIGSTPEEDCGGDCEPRRISSEHNQPAGTMQPREWRREEEEEGDWHARVSAEKEDVRTGQDRAQGRGGGSLEEGESRSWLLGQTEQGKDSPT